MMQSAFAHDARHLPAATPRAERLAGIAAAIALHAVAIACLLSYAPARTALVNAMPLMVSLITPPAPAVHVPPKPLLPKPIRTQPTQPPRAVPPLAVLAAQADARATQNVAPPPVPSPPAPVEATPAPAPVAAAPASSTPSAPSLAPPAPPAPAPLAPVLAPNFNAAYLNNPPPVYPRLARRQGHRGQVVLRVFVSAGGSAETVQLRASCGHEELDQAALEAVRRWRFVPARQGDQPVAAWVLVPINFTLES